MKSGAHSLGFTIVEVMIFLAVSGALLASSIGVITLQQDNVEFNQAIDDAKQQIDTVINNVSNGYYATDSSRSCNNPSGSPKLQFPVMGTPELGTNSECSFLGRVVKKDSETSFGLYSVAGARLKNSKEVTAMVDAKPTIIDNSKQTIDFKYGLKLKTIEGQGGAVLSAFGFFNTFGATVIPSSDILQSKATQNDFIGINMTTDELPNNFATLYSANPQKNPKDGISLCFENSQSTKKGIITIGGGGRSATTSLIISSGVC